MTCRLAIPKFNCRRTTMRIIVPGVIALSVKAGMTAPADEKKEQGIGHANVVTLGEPV
jgi:hypothetical protein